MCSSMLKEDYNNNEEEELKKILTKDCFYYPKSNIKNTVNDFLPIELILLLSKLKNIKILLFQIKKIDEQFTKMAIFILINIKWLFINEIEEIKFDLGNEEMQKELNDINCREPEEDIFFDNHEPKGENNKKIVHLHSSQPSNDTSIFDNHTCNIHTINIKYY